MPGESDTEHYSTRIPTDEADQIEEWREREGLNKSEAVRELTLTGLEEYDRRSRLFERALEYGVGVSLIAALTLALSFVAIAAATAIGVVAGASPWYVLIALALVTLGGFIAWMIRAVGIARRIDSYLAIVEARLDMLIGGGR